jgi:hypothetical protein
MYKQALDTKLFSSQRHMAVVLNVSQANLSMALALASLPEQVIRAFPSPLELQFRWASELSQALERDRTRVISRCGPALSDNSALAAIAAGVLCLYREFLSDYEPRLREVARPDLAESFHMWRQKL